MTVTQPLVNVEMAKAWDGDEGDDWTQHADQYEASGRYLSPHLDLVGLLTRSSRVLDVGCGTGRATLEAARLASSGQVVGVDLSSKMIAYAGDRARAEGLDNVEFLRADAQVHPFEPATFDVAFSVFGAMFFEDPIAAFTNVHRTIADGGRLALLAWRPLEENEWLLTMRAALALGRTLPAPPTGAPARSVSPTWPGARHPGRGRLRRRRPDARRRAGLPGAGRRRRVDLRRAGDGDRPGPDTRPRRRREAGGTRQPPPGLQPGREPCRRPASRRRLAHHRSTLTPTSELLGRGLARARSAVGAAAGDPSVCLGSPTCRPQRDDHRSDGGHQRMRAIAFRSRPLRRTLMPTPTVRGTVANEVPATLRALLQLDTLDERSVVRARYADEGVLLASAQEEFEELIDCLDGPGLNVSGRRSPRSPQ